MRLKLSTAIVLLIVLFSCDNPKTKTANISVMEKQLNLDSLLSSDDSEEIILAIDDHIHALLTTDEAFDRLTQPQKNFYYIQELEREVNNGGFNQYFYNSSGDYAHETILALEAIGAENARTILAAAVNEFPDHLVPKDRDERQEALAKIESKAQESWDKLDSEFYTYPDDLDALNIEYVKRNRKDFER